MKQRVSESSGTYDELQGANDASQDAAEPKSEKYPKEISASSIHDDSPIDDLDDDKLGFDVYAESIAKCILKTPNPNGNVIAIHGSWGTGKSSLVNLVVNDIKRLSEESSCPIVIRFNSWLYRTEDGIVNGFFKEFYSGLKSQLDDTSINLRPLLKLSEQVAGMVTAIKPGADLLFSSVAGAAVSKVGEAISSGNRVLRKAVEDPQSIEELRSDLCDKLQDIDKHILIIIDDIDRLSPEEAIAVFRLIKSVGKLTNVVYLLAYDRKVADRMIKKIYPSEKGLYLEKIVQAGFDLPDFSDSSILSMLETRFIDIFGNAISEGHEYIFNTIDSIVVPEIQTPRDVHRLANIISVTYPSVRDDVNIADFIAIETFRLFRPSLYQEIRSRKLLLTEAGTSLSNDRINELVSNIETEFLSNEPKSERGRLKKSLLNVFPSLQPNSSYSAEDIVLDWNKNKRVCSALHFETYFRLSVSKGAISEAEFIYFIERVDERDFVKEKLTEYIGVKPGYGRTKASFLLDKVAYSKEILLDSHIKGFLVTLYEMLDKIDNPSDSRVRFFHREDNFWRVKKLSENLLYERFDLEKTSAIMFDACKAAPLKYRVSLCASMCRQYQLGNRSGYQGWVFLTHRDASDFQSSVLDEIRDHAKDNSIINFDGLPLFLSNWEIISYDQNEVKDEFRHMIEGSHDHAIIAANQFISLFPDESKDDNPEKSTLIAIGSLIDVNHFVTELYRIIPYENATERDKRVANRLIRIFGHVDPSWSQPG